MKQRLGLWLYKQACRLCPAIPLAMLQVAQEHGTQLAQQTLHQHTLQAALQQHQQAVAQRAARQ